MNQKKKANQIPSHSPPILCMPAIPHSEKASEIQYRKTILQEVEKKLLLSLEGDEKAKEKKPPNYKFLGGEPEKPADQMLVFCLTRVTESRKSRRS
jgi:hypothetical protein